jgi:hypothetical protein
MDLNQKISAINNIINDQNANIDNAVAMLQALHGHALFSVTLTDKSEPESKEAVKLKLMTNDHVPPAMALNASLV